MEDGKTRWCWWYKGALPGDEVICGLLWGVLGDLELSREAQLQGAGEQHAQWQRV